MSFKYKHRLRLTAVDALSGPLPYTAYDVGETEYLGTYDGSLSAFIADITERGYHYQLFAARKRHEDHGVKDSGSYARIASEHPQEATETALAELPPRECQYHVHPIVIDDTAEVYGHYEIHPYPWEPHWDLTRPWPRHYRPTYGETYLKGVRDDRLNDILQ